MDLDLVFEQWEYHRGNSEKIERVMFPVASVQIH
jgi:hypothetical protein